MEGRRSVHIATEDETTLCGVFNLNSRPAHMDLDAQVHVRSNAANDGEIMSVMCFCLNSWLAHMPLDGGAQVCVRRHSLQDETTCV